MRLHVGDVFRKNPGEGVCILLVGVLQKDFHDIAPKGMRTEIHRLLKEFVQESLQLLGWAVLEKALQDAAPVPMPSNPTSAPTDFVHDELHLCWAHGADALLDDVIGVGRSSCCN